MSSMISVGRPSPDQYGRVGDLVLLVDRYIYPPLLGSAKGAGDAMRVLMEIPNSPFSPELVRVASVRDAIAGVIVYYTSPFSEKPDLSRFFESVCVPPTCERICRDYLVPMIESLKDGEAYIPCVATDPGFRGQGVASTLIAYALRESHDMNIALDVLVENAGAIRLYERFGFRIVEEKPGYALDQEPPRVYRMLREAGAPAHPR